MKQNSTEAKTALSGSTCLLFGAGASAEAGIPTAKEMAAKIFEDLKSPWDKRIKQAIATALGGVRLHASVVEQDPFSISDVEDVFQALCLLAERDKNPLASFVGAWSHAVEAADGPDVEPEIGNLQRGLAKGFDASATSVVKTIWDFVRRGGRSIPPTRSSAVNHWSEAAGAIGRALGVRASEGGAFVDARDHVLDRLRTFCSTINSTSVSYLAPLVRSAQSQQVWIATLNYDLSLECAARLNDVTVDLGVRSDATVRFGGDSRFCVAKLHGSIAWQLTPEGTIRVQDSAAHDPCLIFGTGSKLRVDGPYLDLLFAFRDRLKESERLVACGYSFRDGHVNHLVLDWLQQEPNHQLVIVDPALTSEGLLKNIEKALAGKRRLNRTQLLKQTLLLNEKTSEWIAREYPMDCIATQ